MSSSTAVKVGKTAVKVFKKDLPNRVRRGLIESTRKSNNHGFAPNGFQDIEADAFFTQKELERLNTRIAFWEKQPCECRKVEDPFGCTCCPCCDYACSCGYHWTCSRCETLDNLKFSDWVDFESDTPTHIPDLGSTKGSMRDGTTWRRKPTNPRPTRVQVKKMKTEHRDDLMLC